MTPSAWSQASNDQVQNPQQTSKYPPKGGIGPRTPLPNQTAPGPGRGNMPVPTDISQLGPPPSDVKTYAPPFSRNQLKIFGKLIMTVVRAKNLKAGQGTFGRANPYVRIKIGHNEVMTEAHTEGGKNPVSLVSTSN
jgi:hypothetical protein